MIQMTYITGDTHGDFRRVAYFCDAAETKSDDILIILGDAGINYYEDYRDTDLKTQIAGLPITLFCIHGNHEARPECSGGYKETPCNGGKVFIESEYPNILFAKDGEIFDFNGTKAIVIGGAYSVDKHFRLENGWKWWNNEQVNDKMKAYVEGQLAANNNQIEVVLSHTCPLKYQPTESFLPGIDPATVDKSTEIWLDGIEKRIQYRKWYCGHYHIEKQIDKLEFLFGSIKKFI